ncbi:MAG: hypothetical protein ACON49_07045 [Candidatus Puniceispirillaceae bacterium]
MAKQTTNMTIEGESEAPVTTTKGGVFGHIFSFLWFFIKVPFFLISLPFRLIFWPFRGLYYKWFGPPPLIFGALPVDHSAPDFSKYEDTGMFRGQIVFLLITSFFAIAFF